MIAKVFELRPVIYRTVLLPYVLLTIYDRCQPTPTVSTEHDPGQQVLTLGLPCYRPFIIKSP